MKKLLAILVASLLAVGACFAELKEINLGKFSNGDIKGSCWNDNTLRIEDSTGMEALINVMSIQSAVECSKVMEDLIVENNIETVESFISFLDSKNFEYNIYKFNNSEDYFYNLQPFYEEHLVPTYSLKSGWKDDEKEKWGWNPDINRYTNIRYFHEDYTIEYLNFDKELDGYKDKVVKYSDRKMEYTNYDKDKEAYLNLLITYDDDTYVKEYDYNKSFGWYDTCDSFSKEGTLESKFTEYNTELGCWNNQVDFYSDYEERWSNPVKTPTSWQYSYCKTVYYNSDYYEERFWRDWLLVLEDFDYFKFMPSDLSKNWGYEDSEYDSDLKRYRNHKYYYEDRTVVWSNPDSTGYYNVDIYDNDNNLVSYDHIIRNVDEKHDTRDIDVLSDSIIYHYYGVKEPDENDMIEFKLCVYENESGKKIKIRNKKISREEFYKKGYSLL